MVQWVIGSILHGEPIGKSSPCGAKGFPLLYMNGPLLTPYNRKQNVLSASLIKTFPSFPPEPPFGGFQSR